MGFPTEDRRETPLGEGVLRQGREKRHWEGRKLVYQDEYKGYVGDKTGLVHGAGQWSVLKEEIEFNPISELPWEGF